MKFGKNFGRAYWSIKRERISVEKCASYRGVACEPAKPHWKKQDKLNKKNKIQIDLKYEKLNRNRFG